jgi:hypothetical protein
MADASLYDDLPSECVFLAQAVGVAVSERLRSSTISEPLDVNERADMVIDGRPALVYVQLSTVEAGSDFWLRRKLDIRVAALADCYGTDGVELVGINIAGLSRKYATPEESRKYRKDGGLYASQRDTDEPLDEYYSRAAEAMRSGSRIEVATARVGQDDIEAAREYVEEANRMRRDYDTRKTWPRNPHACVSRGSVCPHLLECRGVTP